MRDLRLDLHRFPGQLSKDLLTEQNILSRLQLDVPGLRTWEATRQQPSILTTTMNKEAKVTKPGEAAVRVDPDHTEQEGCSASFKDAKQGKC